MAMTPSSISEQQIASEAPTAPAHSLQPHSAIAEIKWSVLPAALQQALGCNATAWIDHDQQSYFGITIHRTNSTTTPFRLDAWVLASSENLDQPRRRTIFQWNAVEVTKISEPIILQTGGDDETNNNQPYLNTLNTNSIFQKSEQTHLHLLNGRPDRLSIDVITESGQAICRLTYIIQPDGKISWWARSILPSLLNLKGGRYELIQVEVAALSND